MFRIVSTCKGGGYSYCRTDPPHPKANAKGLYPLHRVLVENRLGRLLEPHETVHHHDGDKTNDTDENLEVVTRSEHARLHALERAPELMWFVCPVCDRRFSLKPHLARLRQRRSRGELSCSRRCGRLRVVRDSR